MHKSTVHGFQYLAPFNKTDEQVTISNGSLYQRFFWLCTITVAFGFSGYILYHSYKEANDSPIITTVDSVPIQKVPFPAVTINAGRVLNPWGFVEKVFSLVDYECYDTPYNCPESKEKVRKDLHFLFKDIMHKFFKTLLDKWKDMSLSELEEIRETNIWNRSTGRVGWSPVLHETVDMLAIVMGNKQSRTEAD